jgi:uncharacterized protein
MTLIDNGLEILSPGECRDLLRRTTVGRVAVTVGALPAIFPVNYALLGDDIVFSTGEGTKLRAAVDRAVVAFQIDDFDATIPYGWSVLAVGMATEITDPEQLSAVKTSGSGRSPAATGPTSSRSGRSSSRDAESAQQPSRTDP